jgi:hypothetical protein
MFSFLLLSYIVSCLRGCYRQNQLCFSGLISGLLFLAVVPDLQLPFCDGRETGAMLKIFKKIVGNNFQTAPSIMELSGDLHEDR